MQEAERDERDDPDLGIEIGCGGANCGENPWILNSNCGFDPFDPFDAKRIGDFSQKDVEATAVVEPSQGEGSDNLGGAVFRLKGGKVRLGFG